MRFFGLGEFSLCPETHFKGIFKFKGGGGVNGCLWVRPLPFIYAIYCLRLFVVVYKLVMFMEHG